MAIKDELLDELLADYKNPEDLLGKDGVFQDLKKRLLERALGAELTHHLGYEKGDRTVRHGTNTRNGNSKKKVKGDDGEMEIAVPRDREASFEPQIIRKGQSRFDGLMIKSSPCMPGE